ncbi:MAG: hypothetical protein RR676_12990 [Acinetobacter sp.]
MEKSNDELYDIIKFYKSDIEPFRYFYKCMFGIQIDFSIDPDQVCHLIFGSVAKLNIPNASEYKGNLGYNNISNKKITKVPRGLKENYETKRKAFFLLPKLLKKPDVIFFNDKIVESGNIKGLQTTRIDGDFLLYKQIDKINVHLFLKWSYEKKTLVPYSLINNKKDNYILNQKKLKVVEQNIYKK